MLRTNLAAFALWLGFASIASAQSISPIDEARAHTLFQEARTLCERDGGRLWGVSLCGAIMLVEPHSRAVVANQADPSGALTETGGLFIGRLPDDIVMSNTPTDWSGAYWTQMIWPALEETSARRVMVMHELFHRIWRDLDIPHLPDVGNQHLDMLEGRYLMQLEWRALARALSAHTPVARNQAIADALLFRAERYRLFPNAAQEEHALELNEGIAEYTGVRLGLDSQDARIAHTLWDLSAHTADPTFVRSFAYATGPAYGLLLDRADPHWRSKLNSGRRLDELLLTSTRRRIAGAMGAGVQVRFAAYDDGTLRAAELHREAERQERLTGYRAQFVQGPVMNLPLSEHMVREFRPPTLVSFDGFGIVYPTVRLTDEWGSLVVSGGAGALLSADMSQATVSMAGVERDALNGDGWALTLNPGWSIGPGDRPGDFTIASNRR